MAKIKWANLSSAQRAAIITATAVDAGLRIWAVSDLGSRTDDEVNGSKFLWKLGLATVNSAGILPAVYLLRGRRAASTKQAAS